jgi:hypothetical protein
MVKNKELFTIPFNAYFDNSDIESNLTTSKLSMETYWIFKSINDKMIESGKNRTAAALCFDEPNKNKISKIVDGQSNSQAVPPNDQQITTRPRRRIPYTGLKKQGLRRRPLAPSQFPPSTPSQQQNKSESLQVIPQKQQQIIVSSMLSCIEKQVKAKEDGIGKFKSILNKITDTREKMIANNVDKILDDIHNDISNDEEIATEIAAYIVANNQKIETMKGNVNILLGSLGSNNSMRLNAQQKNNRLRAVVNKVREFYQENMIDCNSKIQPNSSIRIIRDNKEYELFSNGIQLFKKLSQNVIETQQQIGSARRDKVRTEE